MSHAVSLHLKQSICNDVYSNTRPRRTHKADEAEDETTAGGWAEQPAPPPP